MKKILGAPMFVNIVNTGNIRGGVRQGKISDDQLAKRTEQLAKRAASHDKSSRGREQRDKTWDRLNKKHGGTIPRTWFNSKKD